jgi:3-oxoacyl-[acyl-carrier protein] reductase
MKTLNGQVAVVTGAGRGIGRAIALALAEAGARPALVARSVDQLESVARQIQRMGCETLVVPADISVESDVARLEKETEKAFGRVDILVNNAAAFGGGPVVSMTIADWDRVIDTNLRGVFLVTRAFLPMMIRQNAGSIVMIASTSGKRGDPGASAYAASKFGLIGFSQSLTAEVRRNNIRVAVISPSSVDTRIMDASSRPESGSGSRLNAEDVASVVLHTLLLPPRVLVREVELWTTNPGG